MRHRLFVYGTLKKGFPNHDHYMASARQLGKYRTIERYPLVLYAERHVPSMLNCLGDGHHIEGELYDVDDEGLNRIDALERIQESDGYKRYVIRVSSLERATPKIKEAYAYLMPPEQVTDRRSNFLKTYKMDDAKNYRPQRCALKK